MGALYGVAGAGPDLSRERALARLCAQLARRAPAGISDAKDGDVAVGAARPRNLEADAGWLVTCDARLDNRRELITALALTQPLAESLTDAGLILAAYRRWGEECPAELLGDFAFVIWDPARRQVFAARDHLGCKPLYYRAVGDVLVLASNARALAAYTEPPAQVNEARLVDFLLDESEGFDYAVTPFHGVYRLPPGHRLRWRAGRLSVSPYWKLPDEPELSLSSDAEYAEALYPLLREAVTCRLEDCRRPAAMLSGGLDSATVVALARDSLQAAGARPLLTVSAQNSVNPACEESACSQAVIACGGLDAKTLQPSSLGTYARELGEWFAHLEDPFDSTMVLVMAVNLLAKSEGADAILTGVDGDTVAGVTADVLPYWIRDGHWSWAKRELASRRAHWPADAQAPGIWSILGKALQPTVLRRWLQQRRLPREFAALLADSAISPEFAASQGAESRYLDFVLRDNPELAPTLRAAIRQQVLSPSLTAGIERYERVASAVGLEVRHPLLDRRLVEFFLRVPLPQRYFGGRSKHLLRRTAGPLLPDRVLSPLRRRHLSPLYHLAFHQLLCEGELGFSKTLLDRALSDSRIGIPATAGIYGPRAVMESQAVAMLLWQADVS